MQIASVTRSLPAPSAAPESSHYVVGQDRQGCWVAFETHGRGGGLFVSRAAALHHAAFETDHRPDGVELAAAPVSLGFGRH